MTLGPSVRSDMSVPTDLWYANTGSEVCARRETTANFCTSMTCLKCLNAISSCDLVSVLLCKVVIRHTNASNNTNT